MNNGDLTRAEIAAAAQAAWDKMTANERHGIRFGLFPAWIGELPAFGVQGGRLFHVALMAVADKNGGMRA